MLKVVVTGGAGFIGSALIRHIMLSTDWSVVNIDKLTYAGNLDSLSGYNRNGRYSLYESDICDAKAMNSMFREHQPDIVMHLAAESHVDRSIDGPEDFIKTNVNGTFNL